MKIDFDNFAKAREEAISKASTLEYQLEQAKLSLNSMESDLVMS